MSAAKAAQAALAYRIGALICGLVSLPLGLVWAYGLALVAFPVAGLGWWLLDRANKLEKDANLYTPSSQRRLRTASRVLLVTDITASAVALVLTK